MCSDKLSLEAEHKRTFHLGRDTESKSCGTEGDGSKWPLLGRHSWAVASWKLQYHHLHIGNNTILSRFVLFCLFVLFVFFREGQKKKNWTVSLLTANLGNQAQWHSGASELHLAYSQWPCQGLPVRLSDDTARTQVNLLNLSRYSKPLEGQPPSKHFQKD